MKKIRNTFSTIANFITLISRLIFGYFRSIYFKYTNRKKLHSEIDHLVSDCVTVTFIYIENSRENVPNNNAKIDDPQQIKPTFEQNNDEKRHSQLKNEHRHRRKGAIFEALPFECLKKDNFGTPFRSLCTYRGTMAAQHLTGPTNTIF